MKTVFLSRKGTFSLSRPSFFRKVDNRSDCLQECASKESFSLNIGYFLRERIAVMLLQRETRVFSVVRNVFSRFLPSFTISWLMCFVVLALLPLQAEAATYSV